MDLVGTTWLTKAGFKIKIVKGNSSGWIGECKLPDFNCIFEVHLNEKYNCIMVGMPHDIWLDPVMSDFDLQKNITGLLEGDYIIGKGNERI